MKKEKLTITLIKKIKKLSVSDKVRDFAVHNPALERQLAKL